MLKLGIALNRTQKRIVTGTNFDPTAQAFITAAAITDPTQQNAINDLCIGLKAASIFTKIVALYPFVGGNSTSHSYNLINIANYQLTFNGGGTHNSSGYLPNGVNGFANTTLTPNGLLTFNNNHLSYYYNDSSSSFLRYSFAASDDFSGSVNPFALIPRYITGLGYYSVDDATYSCSFSTIGNNLGFSVGTINGTTTQNYYLNSVLRANTITVGSLLPNFPMYIGASNGAGSANHYSDLRCALASIGNGLDATEQAAFYTIVQNYQTTLLRQV